MKNTPAALVLALAVGLVLGLLVGSTLFGAPPAASIPAAHTSIAAGPASAPRPTSPGVRLGAVDERRPSVTAGDRDRDPSPADLERAATVADRVQRALAPLDASVAGDGAITGRVESLDGTGLAGAVIRLGPRDGWDFADPNEVLEDRHGQSLDELMAQAAREALEARRSRREARTDADGVFRFDGLPEGKWSVDAHLDGHRVRATTPNFTSLSTGSEVVFLAEPYRVVEVSITRADGVPVDEAVIQVTEDRGRSRSRRQFRWTPDAAVLHLPPGGHILTAIAELLPSVGSGEVAGRWKSESFELYLDGNDVPPVALLLEPADLLFGDVRFAPRFETAESLRLLVQEFAGDTPPEDDVFERGGGTWISGGRGYVRQGLEAGRYLLTVTEGWNGPVVSRDVVDYAGGVQRHDLLVERVGGQELSLTILTPDGRPLVGADLRLRVRTGRRSRSSGLAALFRDGAYRFPTPVALEDGLDEDEQVHVELSDERYAPASVELRPGVAEYTLQAEAPARIVATVTGYADDATRQRLRVQVRPLDEGTGARGDSGGLEALGRWESDGLAPGRYQVELRLDGGRRRGWGGKVVDQREVAVATGETVVTLAMPPLHEFTVFVPEYPDGAYFALSEVDEPGGGGFGMETTEVEDGELRFTEVLGGRYRLAPVGRDDQWGMEITVPCSDFTFEGQAPNAVEVQIGDEDGLLARIGLASGDLLLEIDGADLSLPSLTSSAADLLRQTSGTHRVRFLRGGEQRTLQWEANGASSSLGGRLTPVRIDR